jgi:hypothetical protein
VGNRKKLQWGSKTMVDLKLIKNMHDVNDDDGVDGKNVE